MFVTSLMNSNADTCPQSSGYGQVFLSNPDNPGVPERNARVRKMTENTGTIGVGMSGPLLRFDNSIQTNLRKLASTFHPLEVRT